MEAIGGIAVLLLLGLVSYLINHEDIYSEGRNLQNKFADFGDMSTMTKTQIISKVGPPNAISNLSGGQLLQWQRTGYHIAILFDYEGGFCGITHQSSHLK